MLIQTQEANRENLENEEKRQRKGYWDGKIFSLLFLTLNVKLVQENVSRTSSNIQLNHPCDNLIKYPEPTQVKFNKRTLKRWSCHGELLSALTGGPDGPGGPLLSWEQVQA